MRATAALTIALLMPLMLLGGGAARAEPDDLALRVSETQRYCQSAKQCTLVYTRCDSCDCGVALNESFADAHNRNLEALCSNFSGAHCDKLCTPAKPMCVMGLCIMQPVGSTRR
ncbi:MAG: hypothetical protein OES38_12195 [Gammaproteobacteria bacterium]|nr:hypothetical protein [Gammaproteobacteria bacterium]